MKDAYTIASYIVRQWFDLLISLGIDVKEIEKRSCLSLQQLENIDGRISLEDHFRLMEVGVELTGNPALALDVGKAARPENMAALGRVLLNCSTLREAARQSARYSKLVSESCFIEFRESANEFALIHRKLLPRYNTIQATEEMLAAFMAIVRFLSPVKIQARQIHFQHDPPEYIQAYEQFFDCPLLFNQDLDQILFDPNALDIKRIDHDPYLLNLLTGHADTVLDKITDEQSFRKTVCEKILEHLPTGDLDIELVAKQLHMSRWTLNRKLKKETASFQQLLQETRYDMAKSYLEKSIPIYEISFLLGYSEPSTFHHAFKLWSGMSPSEFRHQKVT